MRHRQPLAAFAALALWMAPATASAFCGFYVSGATGEMFNNATQVALMRHGTRTVLSMQNNYQGPPSDFAMVIPVPVVLQKENVKTLPEDVFDRLDQMAAPRLVEYWERDPCYEPPEDDWNLFEGDRVYKESASPDPGMEGGGVRVEAEFKVGEYEVVILSADDSGGLDAWLRGNNYNIPQGAEPVLRPYVEAGTKFFVARVDAKKVRFEGGKAILSPLRFHYDSEDFSLPIRLGMLNANGPQDLIVHVLAQNQRYEVANYKNVAIPTNIIVAETVEAQFAEFYAALFDRTVAQNPGAVVTEYAWAASSCDPCPGPTLGPEDFKLLGSDAVEGADDWSWVLTRLHARYTKDTLGEDLIFKAAPPIVGGRGTPDDKGELSERDATASSMNNFQGRYAILHLWEGKIDCGSPVRGVWGGPPDGGQGVKAASDLGEVKRQEGVALASLVREDVPSIDLKTALTPFAVPEPTSSQELCGACATPGYRGSTSLPWGWVLIAGFVMAGRLSRVSRRRGGY